MNNTVNSPNPLLDQAGLPRFDAIRPAHIAPAVDELLAAANTALDLATSDAVAADYDALSGVLDVAIDKLSRAWGMVGHLTAVADSPELRAAYNEAMPRVVEFYTRVGADQRLFAKYRAVLAGAQTAGLAAPRRRALQNAVRNFKLGGAELEGEARVRYAHLQDQQAELGQKFSEHVLDATDSFAYYATEAELEGMPEDVKQATRAAAQAEGLDGHKLTLHFPCYLPVMQFARNRSLRERLYRAYVTRASDQAGADQQGIVVFQNVQDLRHTRCGVHALRPGQGQPGHLGQRASIGGHQADASAHRLDRREAEALVEAGYDGQLGLGDTMPRFSFTLVVLPP